MPPRLSAAFLCAFFAVSAQTPRREALPLLRIKQHMQQRLLDVPNYTCQETIERMSRPHGARKFEEVDRVRLEVAQVGRTELLAWPGGRFESKPLSAFVSSGLMSNGAFVMHARSLFIGDRADFRHAGGKKLVRYDYRVPRERSGYRIRAFGRSDIVAYHGSFWADPKSLDVLRLEVYADSIPENLQMSKADTVIEYQRIKIGSAEALLPKTAELTVTRRATRVQERNRITFSGCRQYGSESMISYGPPQADQGPLLPLEQPAAAEVPAVVLPAGLRLPLILETPLDAAQAAIGMPIQAYTADDVQDGERILIPKGARFTGRLRRLRKFAKPLSAVEIGIEFNEAQWIGGRAQIAAGLEEITPEPGVQPNLSAWAEESMEPSRIGIFYLRGPELKLSPGLRMVWKTVESAAPPP